MPCQNAGSTGHSSPGRHATAAWTARGMRPGRHGHDATAAPPTCATILAIMPTPTEPIPARVPCQDAIPAEVPLREVPPRDVRPHDARLPSVRAVA